MKKIYNFIFFIFLLSIVSIKAQNQKNDMHLIQTSEKQNQISLVIPETIKFNNITEKKDNQSFYDKNMPWIAALIIGFLSAIINIFLAYQMRKSNEKNLKIQINNNKELSLTQFKGTIATKNRQEWINDLRHSVSELISLTTAMLIEMNLDAGDPKNIKEFMLKISYSQSKINLLLNSKKPEQNDLIEKVDELVQECTNKHEKFDGKLFDPKIDAVVTSARNLFEQQWKKIKSLE